MHVRQGIGHGDRGEFWTVDTSCELVTKRSYLSSYRFVGADRSALEADERHVHAVAQGGDAAAPSGEHPFDVGDESIDVGVVKEHLRGCGGETFDGSRERRQRFDVEGLPGVALPVVSGDFLLLSASRSVEYVGI